MNQEGASKASTTRKLSVILNYMLDLSDYALDLSDYTGMSNMLSNACLVSCPLQRYMCILVGWFIYRTLSSSDSTQPFDVNSIWIGW